MSVHKSKQVPGIPSRENLGAKARRSELSDAVMLGSATWRQT